MPDARPVRSQADCIAKLELSATGISTHSRLNPTCLESSCANRRSLFNQLVSGRLQDTGTPRRRSRGQRSDTRKATLRVLNLSEGGGVSQTRVDGLGADGFVGHGDQCVAQLETSMTNPMQCTDNSVERRQRRRRRHARPQRWCPEPGRYQIRTYRYLLDPGDGCFRRLDRRRTGRGADDRRRCRRASPTLCQGVFSATFRNAMLNTVSCTMARRLMPIW